MDYPLYDLEESCEDLLIAKWMICKFGNGARTSASETRLIEYRLFKLLEASTNQQCKHKQISLLCIRQIICLS